MTRRSARSPPKTTQHAYLPSRSVNMLQFDQCSSRSLLFSFEFQLWDPPESKFDLAFETALDIVQHVFVSFPPLKRISFHVNPTSEAECGHRLIRASWEDMDEHTEMQVCAPRL